MRVGFARPDVSSLVFRLFCRPVHPELLDVFARARIEQPSYTAEIQVCDAGHVVTFHHERQVLCEVTTAADNPLPTQRQMIARRLRGHRTESVSHEGGIQYHVSYQMEKLNSDVFLHFHEELLLDSTKARVAHRFAPMSRLAPAPLSFIQTEERPRSLLIHAFHTFPENFAVVKTQSLFEV